MRESGYYWVREGGSGWEPAEWTSGPIGGSMAWESGFWTLLGSDERFDDSDFAEIGSVLYYTKEEN